MYIERCVIAYAVFMWVYPKYGSDRLLNIQLSDSEAEDVRPNVVNDRK